MTEPYIKRKAGDFITAQDWNDIQIKIREALNHHSHTGKEDQGIQLKGAAIDGSSDLTVAGLGVTGNLNVNGSAMMNNIKLQGGETVKSFSSDGTLNGNSDQAVPTEKAVKTYIDNRLPKGVILMWSGGAVPAGWAICDGKNDTPDLRNRFVLGSGKNKINATGGEETHKLSIGEMPAHNHFGNTEYMDKNVKHNHGISTHQDDYNCSSNKKNGQYPSFGADNGTKKAYHKTDTTDVNHVHKIKSDGKNEAHNNMPPYYVLAYIMKL